MTLALLCGAVGAAGVSCGADDAGGSQEGASFSVTDSAGVRIARNGALGAWSDSILPRSEELRIGVVEGAEEYQLVAVRDVVVGPDSEIYAAEQSLGVVRVYSPDGTHLRTLGRKGEGPGEFQFVTWLNVVGNTLLAYDPRLARMTVFSRESGVHLETWPLAVGQASIFPRALAPEGWWVELDDYGHRIEYGLGTSGTDTFRVAVVPSIEEARAALSMEAPPWEQLEVTVRYPWRTTWGVGSRDFVFGRGALWEPRQAHAYDGAEHIYIARGSRYAIDVYDGTGALVRRVTREHEPVPITDDLVERYRTAVFGHYDTLPSTATEGDQDLVELAEQHLRIPMPEHLPVLGDIVVSDEGAIWVERPDQVEDAVKLEWSQAGDPPSIWDVFDPEGRFLGTVELPERSTLHAVGSDWMVVTERGGLDVQYIVRYRMGE